MKTLIIRLYHAHVFFHISRRHKNFLYAHLFIFIIDISQYNRNLGISRYIIKAFLPIGIRLAGSLRGYRYGKTLSRFENPNQLRHHIGMPIPAYRNPAHRLQETPQRREKPLFFHHESSVTTNGKISQFPYKKVPITGMGSHTDNTLRIIGDINLHRPPEESQYKRADCPLHIIYQAFKAAKSSKIPSIASSKSARSFR